MWGLIFIYCGLFVLILVVFFVLFLLSLLFGQISPVAFFRWFLPWPRIGMMSLVTVSPVITAFHSCCLSHHVFEQVNLWPAWVGFETAIFWQCSPGTVETQRLYPLKITWRRPEVKFGWNVLKEETTQHKKLPRWGQKVRNKWKLILRLRSIISKWFQLKTISELNVQTVLFQIIQFSMGTQFKYQKSSISNNSV